MNWFGWCCAVFMIAMGITLMYKATRAEMFWGLMILLTAIMLVLDSFFTFIE